MSSPLLFWILMLVWLVGGGYVRGWASPAASGWWLPDLVLFLLLLILGWHAFGAPIRF